MSRDSYRNHVPTNMPALDQIYSYYPDDGKYADDGNYLEKPMVRIRPPPRLLDEDEDEEEEKEKEEKEQEATPSCVMETLPILSRMDAPVPNKTRCRILPQKIIWDQDNTPCGHDTLVYPPKWNFTEDMSIKIVLLMILLLQIARFFH
jgi:hypothetical protein